MYIYTYKYIHIYTYIYIKIHKYIDSHIPKTVREAITYSTSPGAISSRSSTRRLLCSPTTINPCSLAASINAPSTPGATSCDNPWSATAPPPSLPSPPSHPSIPPPSLPPSASSSRSSSPAEEPSVESRVRFPLCMCVCLSPSPFWNGRRVAMRQSRNASCTFCGYKQRD